MLLNSSSNSLKTAGFSLAKRSESSFLPTLHPKNAEDLARELVRQRKLTKFQATQLWQGKGKSLVLGNYVLMDKIGQGGMGAVYKAEHRRMKRLVAIKMLPPQMMKDAAATARFQREVQAPPSYAIPISSPPMTPTAPMASIFS